MDAKATNIQITAKNGGLKLLQIQDNGTGIRRDDFEIVCERFTTSKLRDYEDLNSISTYGFRGEALASISHVAHLTIQSKTADDDQCAYRASYVDGKLDGSPKPTAGTRGTQITVEDLFYNMNVRRRALRSPAEEYQKISEVVGKYAIHNSRVGFCLKKSGENVDIRTPLNSNPIDNIRIVYGNAVARELVEFNFENETYKFKAKGFMTNVNYTSKKFNFLLFINHRLVDCQSLKRCIDQVYATYLPKNMHPFVYLSLEIDPKSIDVNVHPTKHEVHFLNEEQIVELVSAAVETKLLGSNNSRMFYTQAKLPGAAVEAFKLSDKETTANKTVYAKEMVRTDCNEQKLEKFFGNPIKKSDLPAEENDESIVEVNTTEKNQNFENQLMNKTIISAEKSPAIAAKASLISRISKCETQLTSVLQLRQEMENKCHSMLREVFSQHVFVGCIDPTQALIQHGTKLYLCNSKRIMEELFYQIVLYNFGNFGKIKFNVPLSIFELAITALDQPETAWTPEDGDKKELAERVTEILTEKGDMLNEYVSVEIDENGLIKSIPLLLEKHVPEMSALPLYVLRLASEVDWEEEKKCFKSFAKETGMFYAQMKEKGVTEQDWKWTTEHVVYPAVKDCFLPPKKFLENGAVLQVADLPSLYKVFERC